MSRNALLNLAGDYKLLRRDEGSFLLIESALPHYLHHVLASFQASHDKLVIHSFNYLAMLYKFAKPLIFRADPETAHSLTVRGLAAAGRAMPLLSCADDPVEAMGLRFPNRLGLAAGLDKNAEAVEGLQALGFGFLEVGTVTPLAQSGNPRPRMFRLVEEEAVINRLGFNNQGVEALVKRVDALRRRDAVKVPLGINIGKNKVTEGEGIVEDYRICLQATAGTADYVTINLSSPNTPGLRDLQFGDSLKELLEALCETRQSLAAGYSKLPLLVKLAPDMAEEDFFRVADLCVALGINGLIVSNTTVDRSAVANSIHSNEAGGLSGKPLFERSTQALATVARHCTRADGTKKLTLIGVGGIDSVESARAKIEAGADLLQIYSGLVFKGPGLVRKIARALRPA